MTNSQASSRPALRHWLIAVVVLAVVTVSAAAAPNAMAATYNGTNGNDNLWGSRNNDLMLGYLGNDELVGSWGDDTLAGHGGNDSLYGSAGNDVLNGSYGNDMLASGGDLVRDVLHCGPGYDVAYVRKYKGADGVWRWDFYDGCEEVYGS